MATPSTITVTDSSGAHAIPIPAGYAICEIKVAQIRLKNNATGYTHVNGVDVPSAAAYDKGVDTNTLEVILNDGIRRSFVHGDVSGITVA
jgi:hypothetical protein